MTMPASPVARRNLAPSHALPIRPSHEPQNIHVLVVDDNDINLKILATFMRKIGCSYDTASNGLIALEKYKASERRFDFVLMGQSIVTLFPFNSRALLTPFFKTSQCPSWTV